jgi:CHAT domain-containing protein
VLIGIRQELAQAAPELASLVTVTDTSARDIQHLLAPDEALVEYFYSDKELFVFVMTAEGITAAGLARADLEQHVRAFRKAVSDPASADHLRCSGMLYSRLLRAAVETLTQKKLLIVPHGVLHYVPFCALHSGREYLVDRFSTRVLPSASVLRFLKDRKAARQAGILAVGNPDLGKAKLDLPSAQEEAVSIARIVRPSTLLLRDRATETFVKSEGGRFGMVHIAAHGTFDPVKPLRSALLLAPDATNDGFLRVGELYAMRLNADLVTLSGCKTALGRVANGDDVVGFSRGMLYAGTSSIVSSLWSVPDKATRDLMVDFYGNLARMDKQEALRQAQLRVRRQHAHPYYWAAFGLTGRGG